MNIAFLMDPLESIEPEFETTSHLMYECNQRGHTVYYLGPQDIYVRRGEVVARMRNVSVAPGRPMGAYWRDTIGCLRREELIFETVTALDALFLRKNPPLNYQVMEYLTPINDQVFIINSTSGQIMANSKLYILNFPEIIPETHVSRDPSRLKKIIDDFGGDMVVKPLQHFGGHGVIKVSDRDQENLSSLINFYVGADRAYPEREAIMVQEYLSEVKRLGDVRILLLNGEIVGAMNRRPRPGDFRTNIHAGASAHRHEISAAERRICNILRDKLVEDGLHFVGIDVIGDKLVEVNCVSPGGIPRINGLSGARIERDVVDYIEETVRHRQSGLVPEPAHRGAKHG